MGETDNLHKYLLIAELLVVLIFKKQKKNNGIEAMSSINNSFKGNQRPNMCLFCQVWQATP
jgi:hypothetical protein